MPARKPMLLAAALSALLTGACAGQQQDTAESGASRHPGSDAGHEEPIAQPGVDYPDPGVEHVHGLDVDPADGTLYAATHFGLFALPEIGKATRIAGRLQDTMGFSITGPNTFIGSGHPDFAKDPHLPPRLGLIRSTDAARTWKTVSLTGDVDFHALKAAHGSIYGWDSGSSAFLVSTDDGKTWDSRSTLALRDFAVSPTERDVLLATTQQGLVRSADGGRSWIPALGPALVVLAWEQADLLAGLDGDGRLHASTDGGATWRQRGTLQGSPEALTAHDDDVYAAVADKGVYASADGGTTWTLRYSDESGRAGQAGRGGPTRPSP